MQAVAPEAREGLANKLNYTCCNQYTGIVMPSLFMPGTQNLNVILIEE